MKVLPKTIVADIVEYATGIDGKMLYNLKPEWQVEAWISDPQKRALRKEIERLKEARWARIGQDRKRIAVLRAGISTNPDRISSRGI